MTHNDLRVKKHLQKSGYFPFEYFVHFLEFLRRNRDIIEIITYDDLAWGNDFDHVSNYEQEFSLWKKEMKNDLRDKHKIFVLLQHDVDSYAERTMKVLIEEERVGIRSNVMIFTDRLDRKKLKTTGELSFTEYPLDYNYLENLQKNGGFVVGYHCNAYEKGLFDMERACKIFEEDIARLRCYFNIQYFSAHGGVPGPDGNNNRNMKIPASLLNDIRWVHNGYSPYFDGTYSDGGINSPKRDPKKRDLRDFVRRWELGKRYRILLHPQYYNTPCKTSPRLDGTPWYEEVLGIYGSRQPASAWNGVRLLSGPIRRRKIKFNLFRKRMRKIMR